MTRGKTRLILKDREKVLRIREALYGHLDGNGLLLDEQKGRRKRSRGATDQLLVDKMAMRSCKRRLCELGMVWIDYREAYDLVLHTWLLKCMNLF